MKPKDHGSVAGLKRVHRLHKKQTAADFPSALARVKTLYEDAIEFSAAGQGTQGLLLSIYVIGAAMCAIFVWLLIESIGRQPAFSWVDGLAALMAAAIVNSASYWGIVLVRNEFYASEDEPIIFDRSHRKIYRMYRDVRLGWSGIFRPWPIRITIHDWSLVDVEHHATPNNLPRDSTPLHMLLFLERGAKKNTYVDSFTMGSGGYAGEITSLALWEYIRRFMECRGQHVAAGEKLLIIRNPRDFKHPSRSNGRRRSRTRSGRRLCGTSRSRVRSQ